MFAFEEHSIMALSLPLLSLSQATWLLEVLDMQRERALGTL